jgi:hypothetical protein
MLNGKALEVGAKKEIVDLMTKNNIEAFEDGYGSIWLLHRGKKKYYISRRIARDKLKEVV